MSKSLLRFMCGLVALFSACFVVLPVAISDASASATTRAEQVQDFVVSVNLMRTTNGLQPLTADPAMTTAAADWTLQMVDRSLLSHSTWAQLNATSPVDHTKAGENVGRGNSVSSLFAAFMASPTHRANILDPAFTHIGVAMSRHPTSGRLYTTHRFAARPGALAATSVPQVPAPAAAPATDVAPTLTGIPMPESAVEQAPTGTSLPFDLKSVDDHSPRDEDLRQRGQRVVFERAPGNSRGDRRNSE